jgi:mRNA interferase HigB
VRVIKPSRIREYAKARPDAGSSLLAWLRITRKAKWRSLQEVRQTLRSADGVRVVSGNTVTVFNIGGNKYRLIVAIHYNRAMVYVLRFLTHVEYDTENWKVDL